MKLWISVLLLFFTVTVTMAQGNENSITSKSGIGVNLGIHKLIADDPQTTFTPAGEVYLRYSLTNKIKLVFGLGGGQLSDGLPFESGRDFITNMVVGDLKGNFILHQNEKIRPYVTFGLGIHYWHVAGRVWNPVTKTRLGWFEAPDWYFDGHFIAGAGFEYFINPKIALDAFFDYRLVLTGPADMFDLRSEGSKDSYFNFRTGLTFYLGDQFEKTQSSGAKLIADLNQPDNVMDNQVKSESESPFAMFESKVDQLEQSENETVKAKFNNLSNRVEQLKELIESRAAEINNLKSELETKDGTVENLETELEHLSGGQVSSQSRKYINKNFDIAYKRALQTYYSGSYSNAIRQFTDLIVGNPNHKLASNCQYWIGEAYYSMGNYQASVDALLKVLDYTHSFKTDDALLMLGKCYKNLGSLSDARQYLSILLRDYPDSEYVQQASNLIEKLN